VNVYQTPANQSSVIQALTQHVGKSSEPSWYSLL